MKRSCFWVTSCVVSVLAVGLQVARAQDNVMTNSGAWTTVGNWTLGHAPMGAETAVIDTNVVANVSAAIATTYTGDLILRTGAVMDGGSSIIYKEYYPMGPASRVICKGGNRIRHDRGNGALAVPFVLDGGLVFESALAGGGPGLDFQSVVSGAGGLTFRVGPEFGGRDTYFRPGADCTYSGGTTIERYSTDSSGYLHVFSNKALGAGDVTVKAATTLELAGTTTNVIDDTKALHLVGTGAKVNLNANNETVNWLFIDGEQKESGTWGARASDAVNSDDDHFMGTGILTVKGVGDSSPPFPNPMRFVDLRPTTTSIVAKAATAVDVNPVTYLFTNLTTGASSGWQSSAVWHNSVAAGSINDYMVKARDSLGYETSWSDVFTQSPLVAGLITIRNSGFEYGADGQVPPPNNTEIVDDWKKETGSVYINNNNADKPAEDAGPCLYMNSPAAVNQNLNHTWSSNETFTLSLTGQNPTWFTGTSKFRVQLREQNETLLWDSGELDVTGTVSSGTYSGTGHIFRWEIAASAFAEVAGATAGSPLSIHLIGVEGAVFLDDLMLSTSLIDMRAPTLLRRNIVDDRNGESVEPGGRVTYTVTFSEYMDPSTVSVDDFDNAGGAGIAIESVTMMALDTYRISVSAESLGLLILRIPIGASMTDHDGNALDTSAEILDGTTIKVVEGGDPMGIFGRY